MYAIISRAIPCDKLGIKPRLRFNQWFGGEGLDLPAVWFTRPW